MSAALQKKGNVTVVALIIHTAFFASVFMYMILYPTLSGGGGSVPQSPVVSYVPVFLAAATIALGFLVPRWIRIAGAPEAMAMLRLIISDAFFEAVAIYGLVGCFLGTPRAVSYGLMALSALLLAINYWRVREMASLAEAGKAQG